MMYKINYCCALTFLCVLTRFYSLDSPSYVCWDETHFGKMAGHYINHTFFFDIHPPLGKLVFAGVGHVFGYNGKFAFTNTGDNYYNDHSVQEVPYIKMRSVSAVFGTLLVPTAYHLVFSLSGNKTFDVGLITLSQYILLDPMLLFFILGAVMCSVKLKAHQEKTGWTSFGFSWWCWLIASGLILGCALCTKLVGILTVLFVGIFTVNDLFTIMIKSGCWKIILKHFIARVFCLIALPVVLYMFLFWVHFNILVNNGKGADLFSTPFQASLLGNSFYNATVPEHVHSGNFITVRSRSYGGVILHSHNRPYPSNVHPHYLQQVTGYLAKDSNNFWKIQKIGNEKDNIVKHGDVIHLKHMKTKAKLAVALNDRNHWSSAPLSKKHLLVTAVQNMSWFVAHGSDTWKVQIAELGHGVLKPVVSYLQLQNMATQCYLHLGDKTLPKWGFKQREVTCIRQNIPNSLWLVENVITKNSSVHQIPLPQISFLQKFVETHGIMLAMNSRLTPKKGDNWSRPKDWPYLKAGQLFSRQSNKVYLYGTPLIWWTNLFALFLYLFVYVFYFNCFHLVNATDKELNACGWLAFAWFVHYAPFFFMKRVLFFHHYFPAHIFATCLSGVFFNILCQNFAQTCSSLLNMNVSLFYNSLLAVFSALIIGNFYLYTDTCYGI